MASIDLSAILAPQFRDKTIDGLLKNVFNPMLTDSKSEHVLGYIGDQQELTPGEIQLYEQTVERQVNQLTPMIFTEHATERRATSWADVVQKLALMGIDQTKLGDWFESDSYNFAPPVDFDKLCNFHEYFWVGPWLLEFPTLDYTALGIPSDLASIEAKFASFGSTVSDPEYYVIKRGALSSGAPTPSTPELSTWSDWALSNLWVHRDDIYDFSNAHQHTVSIKTLRQALRPIIEYNDKLKLNTHRTAGVPSEAGTLVLPTKTFSHQLPQFDLYDRVGGHLGITSSIFYYVEGADAELDAELGRRLVIDANADFTFGHALANDTGALRFYKSYDAGYSLKTIWVKGQAVSPSYVKVDQTGTLINIDKFNNFANYYWTGVDRPASELPGYNLQGAPEYAVIELGGTSDWSLYNFWVHTSELRTDQREALLQATRPIIEFNLNLEPELTVAKTAYGQLPRFKQYQLDADGAYKLLGSVPATPNFIDSYLEGAVIARVSDLQGDQLIEASPEILQYATTVNGEHYLQGLFTGSYETEHEGVTYPYIAKVTSCVGDGDGSVNRAEIDDTVSPQLIHLIATSATTFSVRSTTFGALPTLTVGATYVQHGITLQVTTGSIPFSIGDRFSAEIKTRSIQARNAYVKLGGYRTYLSPTEFTVNSSKLDVIPATPSLGDGAWQTPAQISLNLRNETRTQISLGDIYYHLTSIIGAQPTLVGSPNGKNNWRNISADLGLGGTIKQHDGRVSLFMGLLAQEGATVYSLIDFARSSYDSLFNTINSFIELQLPGLIADGNLALPTSGNSIDARIKASFMSFLSASSPVVQSSVTALDDTLATSFYDSSSPISNLVLTLPFMGLAPKTQPAKYFDLELNLSTLVHHDGHQSLIDVSSTEAIAKRIVTQYHLRSTGIKTPGEVTGGSHPATAYKGQFWYKVSTNELFYFAVTSDDGTLATDALIGDFAYDRATGEVWEYNGTWISIGSSTVERNARWKKVDLSLIKANLTLALEQDLYDGCPVIDDPIDMATLRADASYNDLMKLELERFGAKYGVEDVYSTTYDPDNGFTWNYLSLIAPGAATEHAVWHQIYRDVYGTPRPDLQPWFSTGYASEATFLSAAIGAGAVPGGTTTWTISLWPGAATFIRAAQVTAGRPSVLSVDVPTGALLAPYSVNAESLLTSVPVSANNSFNYGDRGPLEELWTTTLDHLYSEQKCFFKISPLKYVANTWGDKQVTVGGVLLDEALSKKLAPDELPLHGSEGPSELLTSHLSVNVITPPDYDKTYIVRCVSRIKNLIEVVVNGASAGMFDATTGYATAEIEISVTAGTRGIYHDDAFTFTVLSSDATYTVVSTTASFLTLEGWGQHYVQLHRIYGTDLTTALNRSLLKDFTVKQSYRTRSFYNGDLLRLKVEDRVIDESSRELVIKENKYTASKWLQSVRIQLARRGSTERVGGYDIPATPPGGSPGDDWVFRVDNYCSSRTALTWQAADNVTSTTFIALNGAQTKFAWTKPTSFSGPVTHPAPFLITGLQNVVSFIFGLFTQQEIDGWRFFLDSPRDSETGKPWTTQLIVEKFIAQQFQNVQAGSSYVVNAFFRKAWLVTERGSLSNLQASLDFDVETQCTLLDANQKKLDPSTYRVLRDGALNQIIFDVPAFTVHAMVSDYEHVIVFDDYAAGDLLIYDPFLGQRAPRIHVFGDRQPAPSGRLEFSGHYLNEGQFKKNIASSIQNISMMYDADNPILHDPATDQARSILGYQRKSYFTDRGSPEATQFKFWQGLILNKGTNASISAFLNSPLYSTAKLDEFWAHSLTSYGNLEQLSIPELRVKSEDFTSDTATYFFIEGDEGGSPLAQGGYDYGDYDQYRYDTDGFYSSATVREVEPFSLDGTIAVQPNDEDRWESFYDLNLHKGFAAKKFFEQLVTPTTLNQKFTFVDADGRPLRADCFDITDVAKEAESDPNVIHTFYERGDYILNTDPPEYYDAKFQKLSSSTIKIIHADLVGRALRVTAYRPNFNRYSPSTLFDTELKTAVSSLVWWDPARGINHDSLSEVETIGVADPARYNTLEDQSANETDSSLKTWSAPEVGSRWWDQRNLEWKPYSDIKIYPELNQRLARWGSLAEYSRPNVYEWVESTVAPLDYTAADGSTPALIELLQRSRTWQQRVVAWRFSTSPGNIARTFKAYQPDALQLALTNGYGTATLQSSSFAAAGVAQGDKFTGVVYSAPSRTDGQLTRIFGVATLVGKEAPVMMASSLTSSAPTFTVSPYFTFSTAFSQSILSYRSEPWGQYTLTSEVDGATTYVRATHVTSNASQRVALVDTPVSANVTVSLTFDKLGITVNYKNLFSQVASWPTLGTTTSGQRIAALATALTAAHQIYLRSQVKIFAPIPFIDGVTTYTTLPGVNDISSVGWVAWTDPDVNPETTPAALNKYSAVTSSWVNVGNFLADLSVDIESKVGDPWSIDDTSLVPYQAVWSSWQRQLTEVRTKVYALAPAQTREQFCLANFSWSSLTTSELTARAHAYANGEELSPSSWSIDSSTNTVVFAASVAIEGQALSVRVDAPTFVKADLTDPLVTVEHVQDCPHTVIKHLMNDNTYVNKYYFWVKQKSSAPAGKVNSVKNIEALLVNYDHPFVIPQGLRVYNQLDGRPNRYRALSVRGLNRYVKLDGRFTLKLTSEPSLRDDDLNLALKNVHREWRLIRPLQSNKIPKELWDSLTESLCGQTILGQALPSIELKTYDARNARTDRYGFDLGEVMTDPAVGLATVKHIIRNPSVNKYVDGKLMIDYIAYPGFEIDQLDTYFANSVATRSVMADIWRFANPAQINEIFFAVLSDALSLTDDLNVLFKTSYISLTELRTIS